MRKIILTVLAIILGICLYTNIELTTLNIIVIVINFVCISGISVILYLKSKGF